MQSSMRPGIGAEQNPVETSGRRGARLILRQGRDTLSSYEPVIAIAPVTEKRAA